MDALEASDWKDKTYVITTNKLKMLEYVDRVVYVEKGRIIFQGDVVKFKETELFTEMEKIEFEEKSATVKVLLTHNLRQAEYPKNLKNSRKQKSGSREYLNCPKLLQTSP